MTIYRDLSLGAGTNGGSSTDANARSTTSVTFPNGALVLIVIAHGRDTATPSTTSTVTGASVSGAHQWAAAAFGTTGTPRSKLEVWSALGTGTAGAITFDYSGELQNGFRWWATAITNADTARGTHGILEVTYGAGNAGTTFSLNAGSLTADDVGTRVVAATALNDSVSVTPKSGWTEQVDQSNTTPPLDLEVATKFNAQDMAPTGTPGSGTPDWAMVAVEIAASVSPETVVSGFSGASGTGAAHFSAFFGVDGEVNASPTAGSNATVGTANAPNPAVYVPVGLATGTGATFTATTNSSPIPSAATGTGSVYDAAAGPGANATSAPGTGTAFDAGTTGTAPAGLASGTGQAFSPGGTPNPPDAEGLGTAYFDGTDNSLDLELDALFAIEGDGLAFNPTLTIDETIQGNVTQGGVMTLVSVHQLSPPFVGDIFAIAQVAAGTTTAYAPSFTIPAHALVSPATGTAADATTTKGAFTVTGNAAGTGSTSSASKIIAPAGHSSGTGNVDNAYIGSVPPGEALWSATNPSGNVVISTDTLLDVTQTAVLTSLTVNAGVTLRLDPSKNVQIRSTGNIIVNGTLHNDLASSYGITHRVTFSGVNEANFVGGGMDPLSTDVGLWVMGDGMLDLCGATRSGWKRATATLAIGATGCTLDSAPTGWQVGDELIFCPSKPNDIPGDFESRTLATISGTTLTWSGGGLTFAHPSVTLRDGSIMGTEILNVTRNMVIEGTAGHRSHVFIRSMMPSMICHTLFQELGPQADPNDRWTDMKLGRYALHFHHSMSDGSVIESCVVRNSSHAYVPHMSNNHTFLDCVSYDTIGPAFWWDPRDIAVGMSNATDGTLWDHCVAAKVARNGQFQYNNVGLAFSFGFVPNSNVCLHCVGVGVEGPGARGHDWPADSEVVWRWEDGVGHNCEEGISTWQNNIEEHIVLRPIMYRNLIGISHGAYGNSYHYDGFQCIENNGDQVKVIAVSGGPGTLNDVPVGGDLGQTWSNGYVDAAGNSHCMVFFDGRPVSPGGHTYVQDCEFHNPSGAYLNMQLGEGSALGPVIVEVSGSSFLGNANAYTGRDPDEDPASYIIEV